MASAPLDARLGNEDDLRRWACRLIGNFHLFVHHAGLGFSAFIADRASTLPHYFVRHQGTVVVSPEPLSMAGLIPFGWRPTLRTDGIHEYLASGHLLGDGCWWSELTRLGPGQMLWVEGQQCRVSTYWDFSMRPARRSPAEFQARLASAIEQDCRSLPEGKAILTLSGGYDSRALLGLMHRAGRDFETVSYSFGDEFEADWDHDVGAYFARKLGVRHTGYAAAPPSPDEIRGRMLATIAASGGEADAVVSQEAFLAEPFYADVATKYDLLLRGDECWGWGDFILTRPMALWQVMLLRLDQLPRPKSILTPGAFREGTRYLEQAHQAMLAESPASSDPNDLKDYLYWRHREARVLQTMAHYRRKFVPHFAPFLFGNALDVIRELPVSLRCRKTLFRRTMRQEFPLLFNDPKMPSPLMPRHSRFDRFFAMPEMQDLTREALVRDPPNALGQRLDRLAVDEWLTAEFARRPGKCESSHRLDKRRRVYDLLRKNRYLLAAVTASLAASGKLMAPAVDNVYLFRMLSLALSLQMYERPRSPDLASAWGASIALPH